MSVTSEFLSCMELRDLTGKRRAGEQAGELESMGIPHRLAPCRRRVIVSREHVRAWLTGCAPVAHAVPRLDLVK